MPRQRPTPAVRRAATRLEDLARSGVTHLPRAARRSAAPPPAPPPASASKQVHASAAVDAPSARRTPVVAETPQGNSLDQRRQALALIDQDVRKCRRCPELVANRTQTVFGVGNPAARLCFLGEAPGADEDRQGEPFVGRAGQLLNKIMEACGLVREEVYIFNTCKCRPPENRAPEADEAGNCREFLDRQIEVIRPEFICCLGAVAAQNLLGTTVSIGRLRGRLHAWRETRVVCTYHPAYLLRNPEAKRGTWEDMQLLMAAMGRPVQ